MNTSYELTPIDKHETNNSKAFNDTLCNRNWSVRRAGARSV